jgi:hypothetical protein
LIGAAYCPSEGKINPAIATYAVVGLAERHGARFENGTQVEAIARVPGGFRVVASNGTIDCKRIVNAAGPWSARIGAMLGIDVPVKGAPLQIVVTTPGPKIVAQLIAHADRHLTLKQADTGGFIVGGAFSGLEKVILHRTQKGGIGFTSDVRTKDERPNGTDLFRDVEPEDLIKFGLIPEFVGRLPVVATLEELDEEALMSILQDPKNALTKQYKRLFDMEGAELEFREEALRAIARKAMQRKTGARGLRTIMESVLLDTMYDLPSLKGVQKVVIDELVIEGKNPPYILFKSEPTEEPAKRASGGAN